MTTLSRTSFTSTVLWAVIFSLLLVGCSTSPSRNSEQSAALKAAELNTQLGIEYMSRGQYEIALEKLKKAVASDKDYAPGHTMLGVLYETIGELDQAGKSYREALSADPDNGDINNNYGSYLCRTGSGADAYKYFDAALEDPFYQTPEVAMANAGSCALAKNNLGLAEAYLRKSLAYDPDFPAALISMASVMFDRQDFLRARAFVQRYETVAPMSAESLLLGYRVENRLNNPAEARKYRDELMQRFPASPEARKAQDFTS